MTLTYPSILAISDVPIELDGSQHLAQGARDVKRTAYLESKGWRVLRFWNGGVMNNIDGVVKSILNALNDPVLEENDGTVSVK